VAVTVPPILATEKWSGGASLASGTVNTRLKTLQDYLNAALDWDGSSLLILKGTRVKLQASTSRFHTAVVATASLPAAGSAEDGSLLIEDAGAGNRNIIIYAGAERFRIDGGPNV